MDSDDDLRFGADSKVGMGIAAVLAGMVFGGVAVVLAFFTSPGQVVADPVTLGFSGIALLSVTSGLVLIRYGREQCVILGRETVTVRTVVSRRRMGIADIVRLSRSNDRTVLTGGPKSRPRTVVIDDSFFSTFDERKRFLELLEQRTGCRVDDGRILGLWSLDTDRTLEVWAKSGLSHGKGKNVGGIGANVERMIDGLTLDVTESSFVITLNSEPRIWPFQVVSSTRRMVTLNVQAGQSATRVKARIVDGAFLAMESEPPLIEPFPLLVWRRPSYLLQEKLE
ncbi:hypothetical protein [Desulfatiferula olefinivorans]